MLAASGSTKGVTMRRTPTTPARTRRALMHGAVVAALASASLLGTSSAQAVSGPTADWMQPRFDASRTAFNPDETTIGTGNVADLHRIWFKGPSQTNPVVEHGHVLTCSAGSCYNRLLDNGDLVWKAAWRAQGQTVLVADDQIFVMGGKLQLGGVRLTLARRSTSGSRAGWRGPSRTTPAASSEAGSTVTSPASRSSPA